MSSFMSLFTTKEIIIMASILLVLLFIVLVMTIWDIIARRKKEEDISEFEENNTILNEESTNDIIVEEIKEQPNFLPEKIISEPLIMDVEEDSLKQSEMITLKEDAKSELEKIVSDLQEPKSFEDTLTSLEMMEEENAIISYQELIETTKEMNIVLADSGDEPISINEIYNQYDVKEEIINNSVYNNEFVTTPYVSPLGEYDNENLAEIQLENTANLEKLDKEIRKTNQFLNILNELKKNLE